MTQVYEFPDPVDRTCTGACRIILAPDPTCPMHGDDGVADPRKIFWILGSARIIRLIFPDGSEEDELDPGVCRDIEQMCRTLSNATADGADGPDR